MPAIILYEYFLMKYDLEKISPDIDFIDAHDCFLNRYTYQSHLWSDSSLQIWKEHANILPWMSLLCKSN